MTDRTTSFAASVRAELGAIAPGDRRCARAQAAGMLHAGGVISLSKQGRSLYIQTDRSAIATLALSLIRRAFNVRAELRTYGRAFRVLLSGQDAESVLEAAGLHGLGLDSAIPADLTDRPCCATAFLRGAFLMCGTVGAPSKGYHLEWRLARLVCAQGIGNLLREKGLDPGITQRRDRYVVYFKDAENICAALTMMGAVGALLEMENVRVVKDIRNSVNRRVNCESANLGKAAAAAAKQIEAIDYLEKQGLLRRLSPALRATADARMQHPEATLEELGALLQPAQSKSAVNHRLRKLVLLAQRDG